MQPCLNLFSSLWVFSLKRAVVASMFRTDILPKRLHLITNLNIVFVDIYNKRSNYLEVSVYQDSEWGLDENTGENPTRRRLSLCSFARSRSSAMLVLRLVSGLLSITKSPRTADSVDLAAMGGKMRGTTWMNGRPFEELPRRQLVTAWQFAVTGWLPTTDDSSQDEVDGFVDCLATLPPPNIRPSLFCVPVLFSCFLHLALRFWNHTWKSKRCLHLERRH